MKSQPNQILTVVRALLLLIPCSILAGFFASQVASLLYFVFLFPIGLGLIGAALLAGTVDKCEIGGSRFAAFLGALTAVTIYAAYHYTDYVMFRLLLSFEMQGELAANGTAAPEVARVFVDYALQEETGSTGFLGFLLYQARTGISLGSWFGGIEIHPGPTLTWVYWTLECALIAWLTVRAAAFFSKLRD